MISQDFNVATTIKGFVSETTMMDAILHKRGQLQQQHKNAAHQTLPVTGSFEFAASEWSLHAARAESLFSPVFRIGELGVTLWCLEVLPTGGRAADPSNNVAIVVHNKAQHEQVAVVTVQVYQHETSGECRAGLVGVEESARVSSSRRIFAADGAAGDASKWKLQNFIPTVVVTNPDFGFNTKDTVIFQVSITVIPNGAEKGPPYKSFRGGVSGLDRPAQCAATVFVPVERTLATDLTTLLTVSAPETKEPHASQKYHCHKAILGARSSTLHRKFQDPLFGMKYVLGKQRRYPLDVPEQLLGHFLSYLYSDRIDLAVLEEHAAALLAPATKYEVPLLVHRCTQQLIGAISLSTVAHTLQAAVASDNQLLRKNCIAFIARNLAGVVVTEEWQHLALDTTVLEDILTVSMDPHCRECREERSVILQWINNQRHSAVSVSYTQALRKLTSDYIGEEAGSEATFVSPGSTPEKLDAASVDAAVGAVAAAAAATGVVVERGTATGPCLHIDTEEGSKSHSSSDSSIGSNFSHESFLSVNDVDWGATAAAAAPSGATLGPAPVTPERVRSTSSTQMLLLPGKHRSRQHMHYRHPMQSPLQLPVPQPRLRSCSAPIMPLPLPLAGTGTGTGSETDGNTDGPRAGLGEPENLASEFEQAAAGQDTEPKHSCSANDGISPYTPVW